MAWGVAKRKSQEKREGWSLADCRDATLITSGSIKKRIKEKNEVEPRVGCS